MTSLLPAIAHAPAPASASVGTVRQLELTINALARSMRKAIRVAEREAPTAGSPESAAWQQVEHRQQLLMRMMSAAASYLAAVAQAALQTSVPPAGSALEPAVAAASAEATAETLLPGGAPPLEQAPSSVLATTAPAPGKKSLLDDPLIIAINNLPAYLERPRGITSLLERITSLNLVPVETSGNQAMQERIYAEHLENLRRRAVTWVRDNPRLGLGKLLDIEP